MPGDSGATLVTNTRAFYTPRAAAGASGTRHSPLPSWGSATPSLGRIVQAQLGRMVPREREGASCCHCEPTGRANARPMTGSAKQSTLAFLLPHGLLRFARNDEFRRRPRK